MKYLFIFLFLPVQLLAQDCKLQKGMDPISSKPTLSTGFIELSGTTLSIDANNKEIDFFFVVKNPVARCLDENTGITVMFEGGKIKAEYKNSGSLNCDGILHITFKNSAYTPSPLQRLVSKKIVTIRLHSETGKPFDINLEPAQQQMLMDQINCVIKESKTLL